MSPDLDVDGRRVEIARLSKRSFVRVYDSSGRLRRTLGPFDRSTATNIHDQLCAELDVKGHLRRR